MERPRSGFTLVEVLVAILILSVGIIPLVGTSAGVTRMIGRGKMETRAAHAASRRMEVLRLAAEASAPGCTDSRLVSGGPVSSDGLTESWLVPSSGRVRVIRVMVTYLTLRGPRAAVIESAVTC
jgi:prepilin-type N-terminal cleavage/methylation domain-containing protein